MGTANLHQEPQDGQSEEESAGDTWVIPVTPGLEHHPARPGMGLKGLILTRKTGELSIPLPFSLWIYFSGNFS